MRKGISPLVATVILIAATMSIAGILSFWVQSFISKRLEEGENTTIAEQARCLGAKFRLYSNGAYDNSTDSLYMIFENQRIENLVLENLYLFYPNNNLKVIPMNQTLKGNELRAVNLTITTGDDFEKGQVRTNCPNMYVDFYISRGEIIQVK